MSNTVLMVEERGVDEDASCFTCPARLREIWRRVQLELVVEVPMLKSRWKLIVLGALTQYAHGLFAQLEHRLHEPRELLTDAGFQLLPELDDSKTWVSETLFCFMFVTFVIWMFSPFFLARKRFYTIVLLSRLLMVLMVCQVLRTVSFLATQLPAPHYHCRVGAPTAQKGPAEHWWEHLVINPLHMATGGCGDLIFSSHTTFILVGVLTYNTYGDIWVVKALSWLGGVILSLFIIASRKHYSVDIVVAWYTVPLVFYHMHRRWTTHRDMRDEDSEKVDEYGTDLVQKLQVHVEDGSKRQLGKLPAWHINVHDTVRDGPKERSTAAINEQLITDDGSSSSPVSGSWSEGHGGEGPIVSGYL